MSSADNVCAGGMMPELPRGTSAVASGLYLRILILLPECIGFFCLIAARLWIKSGTGTASNFILNESCIGLGIKAVVVIAIIGIP